MTPAAPAAPAATAPHVKSKPGAARPSLARRGAGVLLHVTSLPGSPYVGDLGATAHETADWLAKAGQSWWQMLPVNPVGDGDSPYSTVSSFAGEPLLVDLQALVKAGWLKRGESTPPKAAAAGRADYEQARIFRGTRLKLAWERAKTGVAKDDGFAAFRAAQAGWLRDYALFTALSGRLGTRDWSTWPEELKNREGSALAAATRELGDELGFLEFVQWEFQRQWQRLKAKANGLGVGLIGDLPIFVAHGSADAWAHREIFKLDKSCRPTVVAGCPPDAFNEDGQLWGNALYDWDALEASGYDWWLARLDRLLELYDTVRLDHFIGFQRYWAIPAGARHARGGKWQPAGGDGLFRAAVERYGTELPFIAEDLGAVTPEVRALRDKYRMPGMKVMQFAFDGSAEAAHHKPHLVPTSSVLYTGTHDNDTVRGWFASLVKRARRDKSVRRELDALRCYLDTNERSVHWDMIRSGFSSHAATVVVPAQDLLGLSGQARMNVPGKPAGNWRWRLTPGQLSPTLAEKLATLTGLYDR